MAKVKVNPAEIKAGLIKTIDYVLVADLQPGEWQQLIEWGGVDPITIQGKTAIIADQYREFLNRAKS